MKKVNFEDLQIGKHYLQYASHRTNRNFESGVHLWDFEAYTSVDTYEFVSNDRLSYERMENFLNIKVGDNSSHWGLSDDWYNHFYELTDEEFACTVVAEIM